MIGTRLGSYEVVAKLGEGGMGEVYRARDTKLGRDVAIKVVLEAFLADRDRLLRFEREAKALAALNHPNIATLYGMEESEGRHFLVMELIDGRTLAEVITAGHHGHPGYPGHPEAESASARLRDSASASGRGGGAPRNLRIDDAISIARQIADGLEAAHEKGIVHRDLKPANIKITPDDKVKVLDFGLATAATSGDANASGASIANSPTLTAMGTQAGMILGTASYMSPEQARGMSGDHRSDVFSFGVVLYEMLTGRQPFQGETVSDVLASVLAREPDLTSLPPDLAPRLTDLVKRCLEKHPKRRWQAIGDVRHELEVIAANPRKTDDVSQAVALTAGALAAPQPLWRRLLAPVMAAAGAAAVTAGIFWSTRPAPASPPASRFVIPYPDGVQRTLTSRTGLAISPDGTNIAFVGSTDIYIRTLGDFQPRVISRGVVANLASTPFSVTFSPDGKSLVYWDQGDDKIKRIEVAGGVPVPLCTTGAPNGMSWHGDHIYFTSQGALRRVSATGGESEVVIKTDPLAYMTAPRVMEDGRLLFAIADPVDGATDRWAGARIVLQRPGETKATTLFEGGSDPRYLEGGYLLYQLNGVLFARTFDPRQDKVGPPISIVEGVLRGATLIGSGLAWYDLSSNGSLVYMPGPVGAAGLDVRLGIFDRTGSKPQMLAIPAGPYLHPRLSPDGKRIVFSRTDTRESSIFVFDVDGGGAMRRLTFGGKDSNPIWSSDSQRVIFQSERDGVRGIFSQRADGSGTAENLITAAKDAVVTPGSANADVLLFDQVVANATTLMAYSFKDRKASPFGGVTSQNMTEAAFSADGKWVAYSTREAGQTTNWVYVQPYPATGAKYQISTAREDGHHPVWSSDGRELFYTPGPGTLLTAVKVTTTPSFSYGAGEPVGRPFTNASPLQPRPYDLGGPGVRLLGFVQPGFTEAYSTSARPELRVVLNLQEELRTRVK